MGRRAREEAALRALARKVWGDSYYERHAAGRRAGAPRRHRLTAIAGIGVGAPLLLSAFAMVAFSTGASAHTSTISISCTQVQFVYQSFEAAVATAHESVTIDGVQAAQKDITFNGPSAVDTIPISVGTGSHTVTATTQWFFNSRNQGHAYASQVLSHCGTPHATTTTCRPTTTTTAHATTTTKPTTTTIKPTTTTSSTTTSSTSTSTTSTSSTSTSTTAASTTTSTAPETTTVPESTTTVADTSTTIATETTTTSVGPETSTTIGEETTTTTPVGPEGSTSTTSPVGPQGSTSPPSSAITPTPPGNLPFTGSGPFPFVAALAALGVGLLALGLASLRRVVDHR